MAQHHYKPTARLQRLRAQVRDYFALQGQRRKLFPPALLVGLLAGAPLTGIVRIVEMTNAYDQMLPLLVACFAAYAVADFVMGRPIYEALLERDLAHEAGLPNLEAPIILEFTVHRGPALWAKGSTRSHCRMAVSSSPCIEASWNSLPQPIRAWRPETTSRW